MEIRLIDAYEAKKRMLSYYFFVDENPSKESSIGVALLCGEAAKNIEDRIDSVPTVDPETLPIVRKLREELATIKDILGDDYDLDRLWELEEADRDGRCVLTKCKLDDTVFVVGNKKVVEARVREIYLNDMTELIYLVDFECDNSCDGCPFNSHRQFLGEKWRCDGEYGAGSVKQSEFGKSVFLTREAAEDALKGEQND